MADYTIEVAVPTVGPQGEVGSSGPANTLSIGTVTTGAAGTTASATVTGTAPNQTLNLTIPRGDTGATGATGPQGPTGESGTTTIAQVDALMSRSYFRDFATHKNLNDHGTGPAITFTRASAATYFDANGTLQTASNDVPRFDHSGGSSLGLLIEESRQNLLQRSEEFDNAYWTKNNTTVTANAVAAPDGATTADAIFETTANGFHAIQLSSAIPSTAAYTVSFFAKANGRTKFALQVGSIYAEFNISTGTAAVIGGGASDVASILSLPNGWYRCTFTQSATASDNVFFVFNNGSAYEYTGNAALGFYIWGAQLEAGAFPTSYIPTTSAAVTRSADSAVVTPISSFYNASEGTLFAEAIAGTASGTASGIHQQTVVQLLENNVGDILAAIYRPNGTTNGSFFVGTAGGTQANLAQAGFTAGANTRLAAAYKTDDFALSVNGTAAATDTLGSLPTATTLRIGRYGTASGYLNGYIRKIAYYPKRLSNALLQSLTA